MTVTTTNTTLTSLTLMGSLAAWFHFGWGFWAGLFWEYWGMVSVIGWIAAHQ